MIAYSAGWIAWCVIFWVVVGLLLARKAYRRFNYLDEPNAGRPLSEVLREEAEERRRRGH